MNSNSPQIQTSSEAEIIRRLLVVLSVLAVGLSVGYMLTGNYMMPISLLGGFLVVTLLFTRPTLFFCLGAFFFYKALDIIDTDQFGRIAGLFRAKDIFFALIIAHVVGVHILQGRQDSGASKTKLYIPLFIFLGWIVFQFLQTVYFMGEQPVLAFRAGRHFLTYSLILFIPLWLKTDKQWSSFLMFWNVMALAIIFLGLLAAMGVNITALNLSAGYMRTGVFKFGNPGESIVYTLFIWNFWRFCLNPTRKRAIWLLIFLCGSCLFVFRARIAGIILGLGVAGFFVPRVNRKRIVVIAVMASLVTVVFLSLFSLFGSQDGTSYTSILVEHFVDAWRGITTGDSTAIMYRQLFTQERWPIVQNHPLVGMGFVSPFGTIAWQMYKMGTLPIGHIDVGWLDALMRLGGIGSAILTVLLITTAVEGRRLVSRTRITTDEMAVGLTLVTYVVLMFTTLYSFSYPTYEPAIFTFCILTAWMIHIRYKYDAADSTPEKTNEKVKNAGQST